MRRELPCKTSAFRSELEYQILLADVFIPQAIPYRFLHHGPYQSRS